MKLATTIYSYNCPTGPVIFKDGNVKENVKLMKKFGYDGADLFIQGISKDKIIELRKCFEDENAEIVTLFAIFLGQNGVKLTEKNSIKRQRNIDMFKEQLDNAKLIGAKGIGLGYIRGTHEIDETECDALNRVASCLFELGEYAENIGSNIMLEPINRYEINTLNNAKQAVDYIKKNKFQGVSLLLDLFHMNIEDKSIEDTIRYAGNLITNLHAPDSNRYAVGDGHLDFLSITNALKEIKYDGFLTLEAFTNDCDIERTLKQSADILLPLIG